MYKTDPYQLGSAQGSVLPYMSAWGVWAKAFFLWAAKRRSQLRWVVRYCQCFQLKDWGSLGGFWISVRSGSQTTYFAEAFESLVWTNCCLVRLWLVRAKPSLPRVRISSWPPQTSTPHWAVVRIYSPEDVCNPLASSEAADIFLWESRRKQGHHKVNELQLRLGATSWGHRGPTLRKSSKDTALVA